MKAAAFLCLLFACGAGFPATAAAAEDYPFCLESAYGGGGSTITCRFQTMEQCLAAKESNSDRCYANPWRGKR